MTTLTSLARAAAVRAGVAAPIATVRHVHVHDHPLVLVPLALAGEANAPLAAMIGDDRDKPRLLVVPQPRNRDMRFAFAAELASIVLAYVESFARDVESVSTARGKEIRVRFTDAPQIIVPNRGGLGFVKLFGRSTRFRRTEGEYAVHPSVPDLGRWLTFFAERAEHPGSSLLLPTTDILTLHWATGQSAVEDQNLAALLGWIDPPAGVTGPQAAVAAEDPLTWPPAGPATDPTFDNEVLAPIIRAANVPGLERALAGQLEPTWDLMWRAVDLLHRLPAGASVAARWDEDKDAYTNHLMYLRDGGVPQPRRDGAVSAASRLSRLERAQAIYAAQRAFDDPLVFAEFQMSGEAFAGTVTVLEPNRVVGEGRSRKLRPLITVTTSDPVRLPRGTELTATTRPGQTARILDINGDDLVLELSGGMGRSLTPDPDTMPAVGEQLRYSSVTDGYQPVAAFPARDDTPWTHGGPPPVYEPSDEEAHEEWS